MNKRTSIYSAIIACTLFMACEKPENETGNNNNVNNNKEVAVPAGLECMNVDSVSVEIKWEKAENATEYAWQVLKGMTNIKAGKTTETSVKVEGLNAATGYKFAVRGINGTKMSKYSDYLEFTTASTGGNDTNIPVPPTPAGDVYDELKIPAGEDEHKMTLAFPGAEGGGMFTSGGRGGKIIHVTNLRDSGEGSLRAAVEQSGARTVVFDVAGTIDLKSPLVIKNGNLTIAGQTAPGDGICIKGRYTQVKSDNVIIRFVRFRLGDEGQGAGDGDDAIWGRYQKNIILDHCSMSWSIDESASFYANANMTMQWCYIAESMRYSSLHSKGGHGYGGIWGGDNVSFHHNMLAHHDSRNPRFDHPHIYENHNTVPNRGVIDYRNNVVYNWGGNSSYGGEGYGSEKGTGINMVANYYKPGPDSNDRKYFMDAYGVYASCSSCGKDIKEGYALMYMSGNVHTKYSDISSDNAAGIYWHNGSGHANYQTTSPTLHPVKGPAGEICRTSTHTAADAFEAVYNYGGACLSRDVVDKRTAENAKSGKGNIIDCLSTADGKRSVQSLYGFKWPELNASEEEIAIATTDSDKDGIPDYYEKILGLDPNDASDAAKKTIDKHNRYSNFEMYLHYLVRDVVDASNKKANYQNLQ